MLFSKNQHTHIFETSIGSSIATGYEVNSHEVHGLIALTIPPDSYIYHKQERLGDHLHTTSRSFFLTVP